MQNNKPQITLDDLQAVIALIDSAAKNGGFEGKDLYNAGLVRERVRIFVEANVRAIEEAQAASEAAKKQQPAVQTVQRPVQAGPSGSTETVKETLDKSDMKPIAEEEPIAEATVIQFPGNS